MSLLFAISFWIFPMWVSILDKRIEWVDCSPRHSFPLWVIDGNLLSLSEQQQLLTATQVFPRMCCWQIAMLYCSRSADHFSGGEAHIKCVNHCCRLIQNMILDGYKSDGILNTPFPAISSAYSVLKCPFIITAPHKMPSFVFMSP